MYNTLAFQIFGSADSKDYDIMVKVDGFIKSDTDRNHMFIKYMNQYLSDIFSDKTINCNIGTVKDGNLVEVFKGTSDECNNSLYLTYNLHQNQKFPNMISGLVKRDTELKIIRTIRVILSFYSRTEYRKDIKRALRSNTEEKIKVLSILDLSVDIVDKKERLDDVYKVLAFQYGQTLGLIDGKEFYTKSDIISYYPDLEDILLRKHVDINILKKYNTIFLDLIKNYKLPEFESDI